MRLLPVTFLAITALGGCTNFKVTTPSGFVKLERQRVPYKAVSADGAVLMLRRWDNRPRATLDFWREVVTRELIEQRGYKLGKPETVRSRGGIDGQLYSGTAEFRGVRHVYQLGLYVTQDAIYALEATTPADQKARHAPQMKAFCLSLVVP